ncbi:MAG TPA: efflux RND transporter permease subunit [Candidatus Dormibacteraeota bacterium]|nr:efflux RND transporter permease subunit [Candidatus Dormibacteraeota bacterium]
MSSFSLKHPYFVVVVCLFICVLGLTSMVQMPVDMFPPIDLPVVEVATFYNGMPPEQIENDITGRFERFFTMGSSIDHITSRSLPGVSLIQVYFQPGTDPSTDVTEMSNLAMADLRRLPHGTLPPVVVNSGASTLPVCLLAVDGKGLTQTQLRDYLEFEIRDQIAGVPGATVPPPYGGKYRHIMVYMDPVKLEANQLSPMDVVRAVNDSTLLLPAGDVRIGSLDYNLYTNALIPSAKMLNRIPLKTVGERSVFISDVGKAEDASGLQYNIVRVNGQRSTYVPVQKQGGDSNTISVVNGIRQAIKHLRDIPVQMKAHVVFDQSVFVRQAISTVLREGGAGLVLTALMILLFLGSMRATAAVFLSIPISVMATFLFLHIGNATINAMILSGLALAFSRLIDNSVIVLENIFRHVELGENPAIAAEKGTNEVALAVLAITIATVVVFFPVTLLYGVSKYLFTALATSVVLALFASYFVAVSVVPLYCAHLLKGEAHHQAAAAEGEPPQRSARLSWGARFHAAFNAGFERMLDKYDGAVKKALDRPKTVVFAFLGVFLLSLLLYPLIGLAFFPRTDAGQFVINVKAPTGTRIEDTEKYVKQIEGIVRQEVRPADLNTIVSNIGINAGLESLTTPNSGMYTAFVQVGLKQDHKVSSFAYMDRVRAAIADQLPQLRTFFQSGGLVDSVLNQGAAAPIDVQISGMHLHADDRVALELERKFRTINGVSDVYIPQDMDYPTLAVNLNRDRVSELGMNLREVVDNMITALTSDTMIAPNYWIDPKTGNDHFLAVQYPDNTVKTIQDLDTMPLRSPNQKLPTYLDQVATITPELTPSEVDHYQTERVIDVYVSPSGEDLGKPASAVRKIVAQMHIPSDMRINIRGLVSTMYTSFRSFGIGLILSMLLVFLVLVAQFSSFIDPFLIVLAIPTGLVGVMLTLAFTDTTLNIQSLMGVVMLTGMVVSNSILIVDFANQLRQEGHSVRESVARSCRIRLRPILMTSLATVVGLLPMAFKLEAGSEAYAPLARVIIGGLIVSVVLTVFIVPAAYVLVYGNKDLKENSTLQEN